MAHKKHNRFDLRLHVLDTKIAQFRYIDNSAIIDLSTRLRGINPTNCVVIFPQPRAEVHCYRTFTLSFSSAFVGEEDCVNAYAGG